MRPHHDRHLPGRPAPGADRRSSRRPGPKARTTRHRPSIEPLEPRVVLSNLYLVSTAADSGDGSLRKAITDADQAGGSALIGFAIGAGHQTIALESALPAITVPTAILGDTQPGYDGAPLIQLYGGGPGSRTDGLTIDADGCLVEGLIVSHFDYSGIVVEGADTVIRGNYLGTDPTGRLADGNGYAGASVAAPGCTIGGTAKGAGNVIAGTTTGGGGVQLLSGATRSLVAGNYIGTDATGTRALGNFSAGVYLWSSNGNTIGGSTAGARNVIAASGSADAGYASISVYDSSRNLIAGNYIGTDVSGTKALANPDGGISLYGGSGSNTIGGTLRGAGNLISGNASNGITIYDSGNLVEGNSIGTGVEGTGPLANTGDGIDVYGADNTIGGTAAGAGNLISGNGAAGIYISGGSVVVQGNRIGTDAGGAGPLANGGGIDVDGPAATIGGTAAGAGNLISGNGAYGVEIYAAAVVVQGNLIGTDLAGTAALGNEYGGVLISGGLGNLIGGAAAGARNVISGNDDGGVDIDFGASGNRVQGNRIGTDATGEAGLGNGYKSGISITIGAYGNVIGTDGDGVDDTAEGNVISANPGNNVELSGAGAGNVIAGNLIGTDATGTRALGVSEAGVWIGGGTTEARVGTNSDGVSDAAERNVISGNDTFGVVVEDAGTTAIQIAGNFIGTDITGIGALANIVGVSIQLEATATTVGGTAAGAGNLISGNTGPGIELSASSGNLVEGNDIGADAGGGAALGNRVGVVLSEGSGANTVGGTAPGAGNLISGNMGSGVAIYGATDDIVAGNRIGTDATGTGPLANGSDGVLIQSGATGDTIGGTAAGAGNVIAFNGGDGVAVGTGADDDSLGNSILGNSIFSDSEPGIVVDNSAPQPPPVLIGAIAIGSQTTINGTIAGLANATYRVELFANPAGSDQGQTFLGFVDVRTDAYGSGWFTFTSTTPVDAGMSVTATATDPGGDTSPFSAPVEVGLPVFSALSIKAGGFVFNRATRQFSQTLTITNVSSFTVTGTIELVLLGLTNATLANPTGTTQGDPYITILNGGSLGPGQSLTITLRFVDPTLAPIAYTTEFRAGPIPPDNA